MANKRAVTYLLSINDDMSTMVKKINSALRNISQDITVTNVTKQGGGTNWHNDLAGRKGVVNCHDIPAIEGLASKLTELDNSISSLQTTITTLSAKVTALEERMTAAEDTLEDHEERIKALERG